MRGRLMKMFTKNQHELILRKYQSNTDAAVEYMEQSGVSISKQTVQYWRKVFLVNTGNQAAADRALREEPGRVLRKPSPDEDVGILPDFNAVYNCILHIPDQHAPYQHPDALRFLQAVKAAFPIDLVVNAGDELDYHALSFHDADPNLDSAGTELEKGKVFMHDLERLFEVQLICGSNHGSMYSARRSTTASRCR